jgi:hypothetical protein
VRRSAASATSRSSASGARSSASARGNNASARRSNASARRAPEAEREEQRKREGEQHKREEEQRKREGEQRKREEEQRKREEEQRKREEEQRKREEEQRKREGEQRRREAERRGHEPRPTFSLDLARTLPVKPGQRLDIEHQLGAIRLTTHARAEVVIKARISVSATDLAVAKAFAEGIAISVDGNGQTVVVRTTYPEQPKPGLLAKLRFWDRGSVSYSVDFDLVVPETMPVAARNKFGDVTAIGLKADATISNANGALLFSDGGGQATLENRFGRIEVVRHAGPVTVTGANGAVTVEDVGGPARCRTASAASACAG